LNKESLITHLGKEKQSFFKTCDFCSSKVKHKETPSGRALCPKKGQRSVEGGHEKMNITFLSLKKKQSLPFS